MVPLEIFAKEEKEQLYIRLPTDVYFHSNEESPIRIDRSLPLVKYSEIPLPLVLSTYVQPQNRNMGRGVRRRWWRADHFESRSPPRHRGRPRYDVICAWSGDGNHADSSWIVNVCQAVAWLAYVFLRKPKLDPSGSFARSPHRDVGQSDSCSLTVNLYIESFSIKRFRTDELWCWLRK